VRQYIRDNALFWLNKYRLDGLRLDSVSNIRSVAGRDLPDGWGLLQWIHNDIRASQPWKITVAEDLQNNEWITKDTGSGGAGFGSQWDAAFVHPIRDAIIAANDADRDMWAVKDALYHGYNGDAVRRVIYTESHDEVANGHSRVPEEIWPGNAGSWFSRKRSTLGAALVFTAPGIPMIFFSGTGVSGRQILPRHGPARLVETDNLRGDPGALPGLDPAATELVQPDAGSPRPASQCSSRQ
jgi:1,4-alpha-glucan branching enzyme